MEKTLKLFFPPKCFNCGMENEDFCRKCLESCALARHFYCLVCDKPSVGGKTHNQCLAKQEFKVPISVFSAFEYSQIIRKCIKTAKYQRKLFAPLKIITLEAIKIMSKADVSCDGCLVIPIPLSKKKDKMRGFNQAGIIANLVAKSDELPYHSNLLKRRKETVAQYEQNREERFANLKNAFICHKDLSGNKVLLVDDICTTGATLLEGARALYEAGALEVSCFTLAKKF